MVTLDNEQALLLWDKYIGNQTYAYDFSGRKIKKNDYNVDNEVGWVLDYICPIENGGTDDEDNLMIMHKRTSLDKGNSYPTFQIDFKKFEIIKNEKRNYYYIEEILEEED